MSLIGCSGREGSTDTDGPSSPDAAEAVAARKYNPPPCTISYELPIPEAIVQIGHQAPVLAVLWAQQGHALFSLAEDGSIVVWDVPSRRVIDHARVPLPKEARLALKPDKEKKDEIRLNEFFGDADGRLARISYTTRDDCPLEAKKTEDGICSYWLDLEARTVYLRDDAAAKPARPPDWFPVSPDGKWRPIPNHGNGLNGLFHPTDENLTFEEADCTSRARCRYGVNLQATDAADTVIKLTGNPRNYFLDADLTADGQRLVLVESLRNDTDARVQVLELRSGARTPALSAGGPYHRARWVDDENFVLSSYGYNVTDDIEEHLRDGVAPSILVDSTCALAGSVKDCLKIPAHGLARPVGAPGRFIGTGSLKGCYESLGTGPDGVVCFDDTGSHFGMWRELQEFRPGPSRTHTGAWARLDEPALAGQGITALEPTPDGQRIAVATVSDTPTSRTLKILLLGQKPGGSSKVLMTRKETRTPPAEPGPMIDPRTSGEPVVEYLAFTPDGSRLLFGYKGIVTVIDPSGKEPAREFSSKARKIAVRGDRVFGIDTGTLYDLGTGEPVADPFSVGTLVKGGFIKAKPVLWAASDDGVLHFWDSRNGAALLTFYSLPGNRFFALMPDGRYDTNLGPDTDQMRWLMEDVPWQSLGAQTFMRDYYEPRLYEKLLDCTAAGNCDEVLKSLPILASQNRVLPVVQITGVNAGAAPGTVDISVEVREGVAPDNDSCYTHTRSGIYDLRLFMNNRLLEHDSAKPYEATETVEDWRRLNEMKATDGVLRYTLTQTVPSQPGTEKILFSAYAFNSDRVKSDTATFNYVRPPTKGPLARPRAFVVTIGIDAYDEPRLKLQFAAADARLLGERLASILGYDVRRVSLLGTKAPDGTMLSVTREMIDMTLGLLAGGKPAESIAKLAAMGVDASQIGKSSPDDIVIISFAGHGWADKQGDFYLVPADGVWPGGAATPSVSTLISTAEITRWLRPIDAADIALIIDACHSAASVDAGGFKPGPMGDAGLGQLAYDKGIRILAATQADDVALEDSRLRQGLLTYALAGEGITATGGKADLDGDSHITLDEWLRYATQRLPSLSGDVRLGRFVPTARGGFEFDDAVTTATPKLQEPSLFDFTGAPSAVVLRNDVQAETR
jgi:WD40 repeat protein